MKVIQSQAVFMISDFLVDLDAEMSVVVEVRVQNGLVMMQKILSLEKNILLVFERQKTHFLDRPDIFDDPILDKNVPSNRSLRFFIALMSGLHIRLYTKAVSSCKQSPGLGFYSTCGSSPSRNFFRKTGIVLRILIFLVDSSPHVLPNFCHDQVHNLRVSKLW